MGRSAIWDALFAYQFIMNSQQCYMYIRPRSHGYIQNGSDRTSFKDNEEKGVQHIALQEANSARCPRGIGVFSTPFVDRVDPFDHLTGIRRGDSRRARLTRAECLALSVP